MLGGCGVEKCLSLGYPPQKKIQKWCAFVRFSDQQIGVPSKTGLQKGTPKTILRKRKSIGTFLSASQRHPIDATGKQKNKHGWTTISLGGLKGPHYLRVAVLYFISPPPNSLKVAHYRALRDPDSFVRSVSWGFLGHPFILWTKSISHHLRIGMMGIPL